MISFIADKNRKLTKLALYHCKDVSFSVLKKLIRNKDVKVNGKRISSDVDLLVGDKVEIYYLSQKKDKFFIVYQDQNVIVINKKSGYTFDDVYSDLSLNYESVFAVHRLDRNTSGLMVFALNSVAEKELLGGFKNHSFEKIYTAQVKGTLKNRQGLLDAYLLKDKNKAKVTIYDNYVKNSVAIKTGYSVISEKEDYSVVKIKLYTGKTHQIRAHLAHIGHAIVGDGKYGDNAFNKIHKARSQRLSATKLTLFFNSQSPLYYLNGREFSVEPDFSC